MSVNTYLCASTANIYLERNDTRAWTVTLRNADWSPIDLTGWVIKCYVDQLEVPTSASTQVFELDGVLTAPTSGVVQFTLSASQAAIAANTYYFRIAALLPSPTVATLVRGRFVMFDGLCEQAPATEVDICNLALSLIGDTSKVLSIQPPDTSTQARLCAQMYPMALTATLEMHHWAFATKRAELVETATATCDCPEWDYCYVIPNKMLRPIAVLAHGSTDDYSQSSDFTVQQDSTGIQRIYTDVEDAVLMYTEYVDDPQIWPPNFRMVLAWHLASMLAGCLIRGDVGAQESKRCLQMMSMYLSKSSSFDSGKRRVHPDKQAAWITGR